MAAICSAVSLPPSMGMAGFSRPRPGGTVGCPSALPGTRAGPCSPPLRALSRVRKSRRDSWIAAPWHFQQLVFENRLDLFGKRNRIGGAQLRRAG